MKAWGLSFFSVFGAFLTFWILLDADNESYYAEKDYFKEPDYSFEDMERRTGNESGGTKNIFGSRIG